jgi:V-type H+-transporting ATPase subunit A
LQPLSVELGPGILNNIFDGIQRPLKAIAVASGDCFIPRGVAVPALDIVKQWEFHPTTFKVGDRITAGDIYGVVFENSLVEHRIMLPPGARGNISYIAPTGHYNIDEEVIEVEFQGAKQVGNIIVVAEVSTQRFLVCQTSLMCFTEIQHEAALASAISPPSCTEVACRHSFVDRTACAGCPVPSSPWR